MKPTKVTPETSTQAEMDRQFGVVSKMARGVNRFYPFRRPTPLDKQNINKECTFSVRFTGIPCVPSS